MSIFSSESLLKDTKALLESAFAGFALASNKTQQKSQVLEVPKDAKLVRSSLSSFTKTKEFDTLEEAQEFVKQTFEAAFTSAPD